MPMTDGARLRKLVAWCRPRLKRDVYRERVDAVLADPSLMDPDPEMGGRLVQSAQWPDEVTPAMKAAVYALNLGDNRLSEDDVIDIYDTFKRLVDEQRAPCGECHLQDGETCDICGRIAAHKGTHAAE